MGNVLTIILQHRRYSYTCFTLKGLRLGEVTQRVMAALHLKPLPCGGSAG